MSQSTTPSSIDYARGRSRRLPAQFEDVAVALRDLVESTGALDGALATRSEDELRIVSSVRRAIAERTIWAGTCSAVHTALAGHQVTWLEPSAPEGLYLPPHSQVLYVPFAAGGVTGAALLAFDHRPTFSAADLRFFHQAFDPDVRPSGALPLAA